jgi:geranylgeranyl pyrophosphate synthase
MFTGDFLLSRASVMLARLRNVAVVEIVSTVIEHLVKGEVMQMRPLTEGRPALEYVRISSRRSAFLRACANRYYLRKNYYKTASLLAHSCHAAALLGGHEPHLQNIAHTYGKYLGMAFQVRTLTSTTSSAVHVCVPGC